MSRELPEWVGKTPDSKIPPRVRLRVFERFGCVCQITGRSIRAGDAWECDHKIALINDGENRESNLRPVLADSDAHKAKTADDVAEKSKVARIRKKHLGIDDKPSSFRKPTRTNADGEIEEFRGLPPRWQLRKGMK